MRIAVTSQNFRTVTGHAGKARRFMLLDTFAGNEPSLVGKLDLPKTMSMHEHPLGAPHPLDEVDVLITAGCGAGFERKMMARGVRVVRTSETDPMRAATEHAAGKPLPPPEPEAEDHTHEACGCHAGQHDHG
jgi:predicted Fe-Mo cluster-binding NifX family protein